MIHCNEHFPAAISCAFFHIFFGKSFGLGSRIIILFFFGASSKIIVVFAHFVFCVQFFFNIVLFSYFLSFYFPSVFLCFVSTPSFSISMHNCSFSCLFLFLW